MKSPHSTGLSPLSVSLPCPLLLLLLLLLLVLLLHLLLLPLSIFSKSSQFNSRHNCFFLSIGFTIMVLLARGSHTKDATPDPICSTGVFQRDIRNELPFLVSYTQIYKSLCGSVGLSVCNGLLYFTKR